jgi:drug/metabolite transporter (DMT)-like permease
VNRRRADAALAINTVIWGTTFVLVKAALRDVSAVLFLALRFSVAAVALWVVYRGKIGEVRPPDRPGGPRYWGPVLTGVLLFAGFLFQTQGLRFTSAPKSAFITGLTTVMVPLVAALVYRIRPQISEVVGVLVATLGMGLMTLEGSIGSVNLGDVLTLFAAIAFAGHIVTLGHFSARMSFERLSVIQISAAAVSALSLFWWVETPRVEWQPVVVWAILITGLLCTAFAVTIQAWAQRYTTATRTALIFALEPVIAWVTSYVIAGEGLSRRGAVGAVLILGGVMLVEVKPLGSPAHQNE